MIFLGNDGSSNSDVFLGRRPPVGMGHSFVNVKCVLERVSTICGMKYLGEVLMAPRLIASRPFSVLLLLKFRAMDLTEAKLKEVESTRPKRLQHLVHLISKV